MELSFDGVSLMTSPYNVSETNLETIDNRELKFYNLARKRGGNILFTDYGAKKFTVRGSITGSDRADLESKINDFKELVSRQSKNLDYDYAGATQRLIATCVKADISRKGFHNSKAPFELEFLAPDGVSYDTATTTTSVAGITDLTQSGTVTVDGNVSPEMKLTITINSLTAITAIEFLANGNKIKITDTFSAGDVIIINGRTMKVTTNGVEVEYSGIFPEFIIGSNSYEINSTGTAINYDADFEYTKTYI